MKPSSQSIQQGTVDLLNSFLRGEISAVETYRQAIDRLSDDPLPELRENLASHQRRVEVLQREIISLGGVPESGSGAWGAFTRLIEGGAALLGRGPALAALEEGEDRGLAQYRKDTHKLPGATRLLVESELLPDQQRTHDRMSRVKRMDQAT